MRHESLLYNSLVSLFIINVKGQELESDPLFTLVRNSLMDAWGTSKRLLMVLILVSTPP